MTELVELRARAREEGLQRGGGRDVSVDAIVAIAGRRCRRLAAQREVQWSMDSPRPPCEWEIEQETAAMVESFAPTALAPMC